MLAPTNGLSRCVPCGGFVGVGVAVTAPVGVAVGRVVAVAVAPPVGVAVGRGVAVAVAPEVAVAVAPPAQGVPLVSKWPNEPDEYEMYQKPSLSFAGYALQAV